MGKKTQDPNVNPFGVTMTDDQAKDYWNNAAATNTGGDKKQAEANQTAIANKGAPPVAAPAPAAPAKMPAPSFVSPLNADNQLDSKFTIQGPSDVQFGQVKAGQLDTKGLASDTQALDAMRDRALATGDSPWLKMQVEKQQLGELDSRDRAASQALGSNAVARSQLAMKGGLGGGASERMAKAGARDLNALQQGIGRQGQLDRMGLNIADDQTKTQLLGQTAGLDLAHGAQGQDMAKFNIGTKLGADQFNSTGNFNASTFNAGMDQDTAKYNQSNELGALAGLNEFNMAKYTEDMKGYAAGKQGDAMAGGGGKK